ncbi:hypothetical protein TNCV_1558181 [Trichonephila clavipes]|uniref:Uncharacterized protein n=1 Tax=Trichonephila clavipes TaxID=2585209 RepID=A0A8X6UYZ6_TRICX|nr:hypothetical protein TNCV_1558181 [Trichonephila clavipes]
MNPDGLSQCDSNPGDPQLRRFEIVMYCDDFSLSIVFIVGGGFYATSLLPTPTYSSDLSPLDFFFRGYLKSSVFETPVATYEDVTARIIVTNRRIIVE